LEAIEQMQALLHVLRGKKKATDARKLSALSSSPSELAQLMTEEGGCKIETVLRQLETLANGQNLLAYLERMQQSIRKYPLITELWRKR